MMKIPETQDYLILDKGDIFLVKDSFFNTIQTRAAAMGLALEVYFEIQRTLKEEAITQNELFIGEVKVVAAFEQTLHELESRFPFLMYELRSVDRRMDGSRVFKS